MNFEEIKPTHNSLLMRFFIALKLQKFAWSLRRLHCPVKTTDLVLEVGSGGNPYPRSNILIDAYENTRERHWAPLKVDRPIILGFVENLPFKDKAFDFVIASHVLEHSKNPKKFLSELQRVAKAGYIEVPDAFMERLNPYKDHRLEISLKDEKLYIFKKSKSIIDMGLKKLYEAYAKFYITKKLIPNYPFVFHVRYFWHKKINFHIINPNTSSNWTDKSDVLNKIDKPRKLRSCLIDITRWIFSQSKRNKNINLYSFLRCPKCFYADMQKKKNKIVCNNCSKKYAFVNGIPRLIP